MLYKQGLYFYIVPCIVIMRKIECFFAHCVYSLCNALAENSSHPIIYNISPPNNFDNIDWQPGIVPSFFSQ
jgi:hypothetical protein